MRLPTSLVVISILFHGIHCAPRIKRWIPERYSEHDYGMDSPGGEGSFSSSPQKFLSYFWPEYFSSGGAADHTGDYNGLYYRAGGGGDPYTQGQYHPSGQYPAEGQVMMDPVQMLHNVQTLSYAQGLQQQYPHMFTYGAYAPEGRATHSGQKLHPVSHGSSIIRGQGHFNPAHHVSEIVAHPGQILFDPHQKKVGIKKPTKSKVAEHTLTELEKLEEKAIEVDASVAKRTHLDHSAQEAEKAFEAHQLEKEIEKEQLHESKHLSESERRQEAEQIKEVEELAVEVAEARSAHGHSHNKHNKAVKEEVERIAVSHQDNEKQIIIAVEETQSKMGGLNPAEAEKESRLENLRLQEDGMLDIGTEDKEFESFEDKLKRVEAGARAKETKSIAKEEKEEKAIAKEEKKTAKEEKAIAKEEKQIVKEEKHIAKEKKAEAISQEEKVEEIAKEEKALKRVMKEEIKSRTYSSPTQPTSDDPLTISSPLDTIYPGVMTPVSMPNRPRPNYYPSAPSPYYPPPPPYSGMPFLPGYPSGQMPYYEQVQTMAQYPSMPTPPPGDVYQRFGRDLYIMPAVAPQPIVVAPSPLLRRVVRKSRNTRKARQYG